MTTAGQRLLATDAPDYETDFEATSGTTTSATYTATLTGGTACSCVFVAPTSGAVLILNVATISNSGANASRTSFSIKTDGTVGSGTEVLAADNSRALLVTGTSAMSGTHAYIATGLTPGATYNVQQMFTTTAGTATYVNKRLHVIPML